MTFRLIIIAGCLALGLVLTGLYFLVVEPLSHSAALEDARVAAAFCNKEITPDRAREMVEEIHSRGGSWAEATKTFRTLIGCSLAKR